MSKAATFALIAAALIVLTAAALWSALGFSIAPRPRDSTPAGAVEPGSLRIGAAAPPIVASAWLKGDPVPSFDPGKVYIVEFWATWCAPCIAAMPHLHDLQEKHRADGLRVVSVTAADRANTLDAVERLVAAKGDGMNYSVAFDQGELTSNAYLKATARAGLPATFIVDRAGRLAWIGTPTEVDQPLISILAGTWNLAAASQQFDSHFARDRLSAQWFQAVANHDAPALESLAPQLLAAHNDDADQLTSHCWGALANSTDLRLAEYPRLLAAVSKGIERANALRPAPHAFTLNALARARFLSGQRDEAVALVKQALAVGTNEGDYLLNYLKQFLAEYESARPSAPG
ncbi:hypothetical protein BH11PLA1_BH11PLA1_13900 [soil metagenome]